MCVVACEGEFVWFGVAPVPATRSKHQREWNRNTEHDALHRPIEADRLRSRGLFSMHADHPGYKELDLGPRTPMRRVRV